MDHQLANYIELLRGLGQPVRTGTAATGEQLAGLERALGAPLPEDYKVVVGAIGYLCAGEAGELVVYGVAVADHGCPCEIDALRAAPSVGQADARLPLLRSALAGEPVRLVTLGAHGELRVLGRDETRADAVPSFRAELQQALQAAVEARMVAIGEAAGPLADPDDLTLGAGQADVQMFAIPREVVAALKKEPAVADEITLYTSVEEFREQTVAWEKTVAKGGGSPATQVLVRRMRWLLNQRGISKLKDLAANDIEVPRWPDAIVACFGQDAPESLALRGATSLPCEGTDTIHMLTTAEVKQVADALAGSEERLRAGYQPAVLRARGLYNQDAPNEAAFLEELAALWDTVADAIRDAAAQGGGWLIRRTEG